MAAEKLMNRLRGLVVQPNQTMATMTPKLGEGMLIVTGLIVTAGIRAELEVAYTVGFGNAAFAIAGVAIGIIMAWVGLTALFHLVARALGSTGSYSNLLAFMGYAATPMILTSLVSLTIYLVSPVLLPNLGGVGWGPLHAFLGWIGMAWGWPGLLSYYALRYGERLSHGMAGATVVAVYVAVLLGWFLSVLVPGLFG